MNDKTDPARVFRDWCEGWSGPPGGRRLPWGFGTEGAPTRGSWVLALAADARSEPPASVRPLTPADLRALLTAAGLTEEIYRAGLVALETGEIGDPAVIGALAALRVLAAEPWRGLRLPGPAPALGELGFWWLADEAQSALLDYWEKMHGGGGASAGRRTIRAAALALADALEGPGGNQFLLLDDRVCRAGPGGPKELDPAAYLRALAEDFREPESETEGKRSRVMRPFVLRAIRERVRFVFPEAERTGWGFNRLAAALCSPVLACPVTAGDVANALRGTDLPRVYWSD